MLYKTRLCPNNSILIANWSIAIKGTRKALIHVDWINVVEGRIGFNSSKLIKEMSFILDNLHNYIFTRTNIFMGRCLEEHIHKAHKKCHFRLLNDPKIETNSRLLKSWLQMTRKTLKMALDAMGINLQKVEVWKP